ncbi:MAG: NAD(P)/FAD-dependent oxidoreductase [Actinomycetes bacterium]
MSANEFDILIIGGGHNGLVAACYLAREGLSVCILEKNDSLGGATVSQKVFSDFDARLSRYSYLVSLLPDQIISDLGLDFEVLSREVASFTPEKVANEDLGLLITTEPSKATQENFELLTGNLEEYQAWQEFYGELHQMAQAIAPTLLKPLPSRSELRALVGQRIWDEIMEAPLGEAIERRFKSDLIRGIVLTDGLIGTFADAHDMAANRCFVYHLIGNGSGEWKVPRGGMGQLVSELTRVAMESRVQFVTSTNVSAISEIESGFEVIAESGISYRAKYVIANCAPQTLAKLAGTPKPESLDGSQVKINMLLQKLPRLKSGIDPKKAFAGTFHFDERYTDLQLAYAQSAAGFIPDRIPAEMYCHTLTDKSILSAELNVAGYQTLTMFVMHTPANLFDQNHDQVKTEIAAKVLNQLNQYLLDPIEECLAVASDGSLCIEVKSPQEIEKEIGLPRGNIFHKDLSFPFREDGEQPSWGVETAIPNLFLCGAGAIRGGGVSGIPGHNAAAAVLERVKG